ncbi:MAG: endo alpha-1,4 polygalactosaminidase [Ruminococcus sp.]|nr:endo alpha-1,4 polygalactosaminidase [Ruminococcus sp.]
MKKTILAILLTSALCLNCGCSKSSEPENGPDSEPSYDYGVFIGAGPEDLSKMTPYRTVVLDAQYFTHEDIKKLTDGGSTVYSYINLGALEDFRPYYDEYSDLTLDPYENWEEEMWVDVSDSRWQSFVGDVLAGELMEKGVDGLFVDNTDVYYHYPTDPVFSGVCNILNSFKSKGAYVLINGGDCFVTECEKRFGTLDGLIDGVNQETVFTAIDFDKGTFSANDPEERRYFMDYAERVMDHGKDVFLLEYTSDPALIEEISAYCKEKGCRFYVSPTLELLA